jgi:hypothetical protein
MKINKIFGFLVLSQVLGVSLAQAKFYNCTFTEPFINLYISTQNKTVTIDAADPDISRMVPIKSIKEKGKLLRINDDIKIFLADEGFDGMSDLNYPYKIQYQKMLGGCTSEATSNKTQVERIGSFINGTGLTIVNYWPGEYGFAVGYKVSKDVTLPIGSTYNNLESATKEEKACTLKKGKRLIPSLAKKGEVYSSVQTSSKWKALKDIPKDGAYSKAIKTGEEVYEITYASEGYCSIEKDGKLFDLFCPSNSPELFKQVTGPVPTPTPEEHSGDIATGEYVLTKCAEGHMTWVSQKQMESDQEHFESDQDSKVFGNSDI